VRAVVPKINLDDVFIAKTEIAADVKETLTKSMASFGFEIIQTLVRNAAPVSALVQLNILQMLVTSVKPCMHAS
jgi:regulator of protease activity HflC (stomatin/prohibitin superfamily)